MVMIISRQLPEGRAHTRRTARGFTLIEALAALLIFGFLVTVFYRVFIEASAYMVNSRFLRGAVALMNERMEHYRNITYTQIGIPPLGGIVPDETVVVNDMRFRVITSVSFVDDPHDGSWPDDALFEDYKRVSITVVWRDAADAGVSADRAVHDPAFASRRAQLVSQFGPPGGRETVANGGILHINVLNGEGQPLSDMPVTIRDTVHNSTMTERTDSLGQVQYVGALPCEGCYEISVGKDGYQTIFTEPPQLGFTPHYLHQSVLQGDMTSISFSSNPVANVTLAATDGTGAPLNEHITVHFTGGRERGLDIEGHPVFFSHDDLTTDTNGTVVMRTDTNGDGVITTDDRTDPGAYSMKVLTIPAHYQLWKIGEQLLEFHEGNPDPSPSQVTIMPGEERTIPIVFLSEDRAAVLATITEDVDGVSTPVRGASVRVRGTSEGDTLDVTGTTDASGTVYLAPEEPATFSLEKTYTLTVTADGYHEETRNNIIVPGIESVTLTLRRL